MLKQYAKLEKDIVLVGVLYRFEIMSRDIWDKENGLMEKDLGEDQVRHEIARLGL
jgi:DNA-binding transcriptional regulator/RsmH inhibitor MraZ